MILSGNQKLARHPRNHLKFCQTTLGREGGSKKNISGFQDVLCLMLLSKNLLFNTLGSQRKSKDGIHLFTINFVKLLYLIIWDARTNLIRFFWNLHHLYSTSYMNFLAFIFHHNSKTLRMDPQCNSGRGMGGWKKISPGFQAAVSLVLFSKNLLFKTLVPQITNDFVWKSKAGYGLTHHKFCQATLSHSFRCKD